MSTSLRKIEFYGIYFFNKECEYENTDNLIRLIESFDKNFIFDDAKSNKFWRLDSVNRKNDLFYLIFKSGKYNHSPNYISRLDGIERVSDKNLDEGECEKTHIVINVKESTLIIEYRRSGVSSTGFVRYVNKFIRDEKIQIDKIKVVKELKQDFLNNLNALKTIKNIELYVKKEIIGSEYMNLIEPTENTQEEVIVTVKAERKKTLAIENIKKIFNKIGTNGQVTKRIRVKGRDSDNINVLLDSLNQNKFEQIYVELDEKGVVDSTSFFEKVSEII